MHKNGFDSEAKDEAKKKTTREENVKAEVEVVKRQGYWSEMNLQDVSEREDAILTEKKKQQQQQINQPSVQKNTYGSEMMWDG